MLHTITPEHVYHRGLQSGTPRLPRGKGEVVLVVGCMPAEGTCTGWLSPAEEERCARFIQEQDRRSFRYRRHLLRTLLAEAFMVLPENIDYTYNRHGKPQLAGGGLQFSTSRSGNYCAFAFGMDALGVDIEVRRDHRSFHSVQEVHYHDEEKQSVRNEQDFFRIWTRKEALLKAEGSGLSDDLASINCQPSEVIYRARPYYLQSWTGEQFLLSLATRQADLHVQRYLL